MAALATSRSSCLFCQQKLRCDRDDHPPCHGIDRAEYLIWQSNPGVLFWFSCFPNANRIKTLNVALLISHF